MKYMTLGFSHPVFTATICLLLCSSHFSFLPYQFVFPVYIIAFLNSQPLWLSTQGLQKIKH